MSKFHNEFTHHVEGESTQRFVCTIMRKFSTNQRPGNGVNLDRPQGIMPGAPFCERSHPVWSNFVERSVSNYVEIALSDGWTGRQSISKSQHRWRIGETKTSYIICTVSWLTKICPSFYAASHNRLALVWRHEEHHGVSNFITMMSQWARLRLKSPASR